MLTFWVLTRGKIKIQVNMNENKKKKILNVEHPHYQQKSNKGEFQCNFINVSRKYSYWFSNPDFGKI